MSKTQIVQFALKEDRTDSQIISVLDSVFGFKIGMADNPLPPEAVGVLMVDLHSDGFRKSCLVSWPEERLPKLDLDKMGRTISLRLNVDVLVEADDDKWLLAEPGKSLREVEVGDMEDRIDVVK